MANEQSLRAVKTLGRRGWLGLCAMWLMGSALAGPIAERVWPSYTVGVVPQFPATDIQRVWGPILERVGQAAKVQLNLKFYKDIPTFEADFQAGGADFVYLNPYHQYMAHRAQGYVPLVRDSRLLTGIVVVRKDDPIRKMADLRGQSVAYPAPNAFGASLLIRSHLAEVEHVETNAVYVRTHTNAYRYTLTGKTAASGGVRATLDREPPEVQAALRVLFETPGAAPHPLSAHPRVPEGTRKAVTEAMLRLSKDPALADAFHDIPMDQPVRADQVRDYQPLGKLKLDRYVE